jgi:hypothetical protein
MISSADFRRSPPRVWGMSTLSEPKQGPPATPRRAGGRGWGDLVAASGEISWPPAGTSLAAYGEILTAADNAGTRRHEVLIWPAHGAWPTSERHLHAVHVLLCARGRGVARGVRRAGRHSPREVSRSTTGAREGSPVVMARRVAHRGAVPRPPGGWGGPLPTAGRISAKGPHPALTVSGCHVIRRERPQPFRACSQPISTRPRVAAGRSRPSSGWCDDGSPHVRVT